MELAGFIPLSQRGFALPAYRAHKMANGWHVAIADVEGDHAASIVDFEFLETDDARPIEEPFEVAVGDSWRDVFLWNGNAFAGTPREIFDAVSPWEEELWRAAPLSFLDLVLAAEADIAADAAHNAMVFLRRRLGVAQGSACFRETIIRPGVLLALHRQWEVQRRGHNLECPLPDALRNFEVGDMEGGGFWAKIEPASLALLGGEAEQARVVEASSQ
ncbi:MAG: hypothetical protein ABWX67_09235, partial [Allosphingosinicella sp.]